jgi:hypothetical protein
MAKWLFIVGLLAFLLIPMVQAVEIKDLGGIKCKNFTLTNPVDLSRSEIMLYNFTDLSIKTNNCSSEFRIFNYTRQEMPFQVVSNGTTGLTDGKKWCYGFFNTTQIAASANLNITICYSNSTPTDRRMGNYTSGWGALSDYEISNDFLRLSGVINDFPGSLLYNLYSRTLGIHTGANAILQFGNTTGALGNSWTLFQPEVCKTGYSGVYVKSIDCFDGQNVERNITLYANKPFIDVRIYQPSGVNYSSAVTILGQISGNNKYGFIKNGTSITELGFNSDGDADNWTYSGIWFNSENWSIYATYNKSAGFSEGYKTGGVRVGWAIGNELGKLFFGRNYTGYTNSLKSGVEYNFRVGFAENITAPTAMKSHWFAVDNETTKLENPITLSNDSETIYPECVADMPLQHSQQYPLIGIVLNISCTNGTYGISAIWTNSTYYSTVNQTTGYLIYNITNTSTLSMTNHSIRIFVNDTKNNTNYYDLYFKNSDLDPPFFWNMIPEIGGSVTYTVPTQIHTFTVNINDSIDNMTMTTNFTMNGILYTTTNTNGNKYSVSVSGLYPNSYNFYWCGVDKVGNVNCTTNNTYTIYSPSGGSPSGSGAGLPASFCGDGLCSQITGENNFTCPQDCKFSVSQLPYAIGDGVCDTGKGETALISPSDCQINIDLTSNRTALLTLGIIVIGVAYIFLQERKSKRRKAFRPAVS